MLHKYRHAIYIAPDILFCTPNQILKEDQLFHLKYKIEESEKDKIEILSDSNNLSPKMIRWCIKHWAVLFRNRTNAEKEFQSFIREFRHIKSIFNQAFNICDNIYFADCYLPKYKTIIEIDGGYHNTNSQQFKDERRTIYLNSVGIEVIRLTNSDAIDHMKVASILYKILKKNQ